MPAGKMTRAARTWQCLVPVLLLLLGAFLFGCGYRFSAGRAQTLAGHVQLLVEVAGNDTAEIAASAWLTAALKRLALERGLSVAQGETAPARLRSHLLLIDSVPRAVATAGGSYRTREQEVVVRARFQLWEGGQESLAFSLAGRASYLSAADLRGTETNRQVALRRLVEDLAGQAFERITRKF